MRTVVDDEIKGNVVALCRPGFISQVVNMGKIIVNNITVFDEGGTAPVWAFRFNESQNAVYYPIFF